MRNTFIQTVAGAFICALLLLVIFQALHAIAMGGLGQ